MPKMSDRDRRFCEEYLVDLDAKHAALRAGYSPTTANNAAAWIKPDAPGKPKVREQIDKLLAERSRRTGVTADRVVRELARIAFGSIERVADPATGALRADAGADDLAAVASMHSKSGVGGYESEIRMYDKNRALELLGKHLGMFTENLNIRDERPAIIDNIPAAPPHE